MIIAHWSTKVQDLIDSGAIAFDPLEAKDIS